MTETISPRAFANSRAMATPSSVRSAGHWVKPIRNGRVAGPRYSGSGAGGGGFGCAGAGAGAGPAGPNPAGGAHAETIKLNASRSKKGRWIFINLSLHE